MKNPLDKLSPLERRRFLKLATAALAAPAVPTSVRYAANEIMGGKAYADGNVATQTNLIEVNIKRQHDWGHLFVAPGLATNYSNLIRGSTGYKCPLFIPLADISSEINNFYLTPRSTVLRPHLDTIAVNELCTVSISRTGHGHEACNAARSPGRSLSGGGGRQPMWLLDLLDAGELGNEYIYASAPTPATIHNYVQKGLDPNLRNGFVFKATPGSVSKIYHYAAGLAGAELDRIQSRDSLFNLFPELVGDSNILPTPAEAALFSEVLNRVDRNFLVRSARGAVTRASHGSNVEAAQNLLYDQSNAAVSMPLTPSEISYWSSGFRLAPRVIHRCGK